MKDKRVFITFWIVNLAVMTLINWGFWKIKEIEFNNICDKVITTEEWEDFQKKAIESSNLYIGRIWYNDFDKRVDYRVGVNLPLELSKLLRDEYYIKIFVNEIKAYQLPK